LRWLRHIYFIDIAGKPVLMFTIQWILPIWIMSLLVACGVIKLPFSIPFLDDLIM